MLMKRGGGSGHVISSVEAPGGAETEQCACGISMRVESRKRGGRHANVCTPYHAAYLSCTRSTNMGPKTLHT